MSMYRILALAIAGTASLTVAGCGNRDLNYRNVEVAEMKKEIRDLEAQLHACESRKAGYTLDHAEPGESHRDTVHRALGPNVDVSDRPMETVLAIGSDVLFSPGSAKLTSEAKATLSRCIALIQHDYAGYNVRVDGFTDNNPVVRSHDKWDDNWDLSGGRAQAVLHYLIDHGIPAKDLGFAGFGEERPKLSNSGEASKAKNRRVEIVVAPKQK
jgi:chemotaxis protein MotB